MSEALLFREHEVEELDDWAGRLDRLGASTLLWIDLERPSDDVVERLARELELDPASVERLQGSERTPGLSDFGSYLHVTGTAPRGDRHELEDLECLVSSTWVVTVRNGPVEVVDELRERAEGAGDVGQLNGLEFLADLLTWVLEGYLRAFEAIDVALEDLDGDAMQGNASHEHSLARLVGIRGEIGHLRRTLVAHRGVLLALTRPELGGISTAESAERFQALLDRLAEVAAAAQHSRESVVGSFDVLMTQVAQRTNEIMKTLTIVSLLLLPGTLLAGVLGMNFKVGIFQHPDLFWVALGVMGAIALATLAVVRSRHWI